LIYPAIRERIPASTEILTQGEIVAPSLEEYLARHPEIEARLGRGGSESFRTTDHPEGFERLASLFLGRKIAAEKVEI
jgi:glutamate racemase